MKLSDLKIPKVNVEQKTVRIEIPKIIDEILKIPSNTQDRFDLPKSILINGKFVGKSEGRDVFAASLNDNKIYIFFNKDETGFQSYVAGIERNIFNRDYLIINRTWTRQDLKQKGYLSGIFKLLKDQLNLSIMSDSSQTPDSRAFWKNIDKKFKVKILNLETGEKYERSEVPDDKIYDTEQATQYRLIIESKLNKKTITEWIEPILQPYIYFEEGDE